MSIQVSQYDEPWTTMKTDHIQIDLMGDDWNQGDLRIYYNHITNNYKGPMTQITIPGGLTCEMLDEMAALYTAMSQRIKECQAWEENRIQSIQQTAVTSHSG